MLNSPIASTLPAIKPLPLKFAWPFFAIPALAFVVSVYWGIPFMVGQGLAEFTAYVLALLIPLVMLLAAALAAFRLEGRPLTWAAISDRFRLHPMTGKDWLWTLTGLVIGVVGMGALLGLGRALVSMGLIPLPGSIPAAIDPATPPDLAGFRGLMGPGATGNWGLVLLTVVLLFFNIIGEEFWWRGYILPRQELTHGRWTWVIHGVLWMLFHVFKYWDWLGLLPVCLVIAYIAQRRQNTWPGIIIHFLVNGITLIPILIVVLGLVN